MTHRGTVKNGKVELEPGDSLPEGTIVRVEPVSDSPDPADDLGAEAVDGGPPDLSAEHDHYIYGTPRRGDQAC